MFSQFRRDIDTIFLMHPFRMLVAVRIFFILVTIICSAAYPLSSIFFDVIRIGLLLGFFAKSLVTLRNVKSTQISTLKQLSIDPIIISILVYSTGGPLSPFVFLFVPLVVYAAFFFGRDSGVFIICLSSALNMLIGFGIRLGLFLVPSAYSGTTASYSFILFQAINLAVAMSAVFFATNYLRSLIDRKERAARDAAQLITEGEERNRLIFDAVSDALITTNEVGFITSVNSVAKDLLRRGDELLGKSIDQSLRSIFPGFSFLGYVHGKSEKKQQLTLRDENNQQKFIECVEKVFFTPEGNARGSIFLFKDITEEKKSEETRLAQLQYQVAKDRVELAREPVIGTAGLVGESKLFRKVLDLVRRVASSDATVLLYGESGTGKELIARAIHQQSGWSKGPFVAVNCGAIPSSLIESQLFGHKRGSFTGATTDHIGFFREAMNGTLFLDEIGELPIAVQATLLRAIQERSVRPVGGSSDIPINVRIIAATNKNLRRESEAGKFREDLYYRLNVVNITIPPLRERREDLPLLIGHFLRQLQREEDKELPELASETLRLLVSYNYPGNIRELENIIQRAVVLGGSLILPEHLPEQVQALETRPALIREETAIHELPCDLDAILSSIERDYVIAALHKSGGTRKTASELLGLNLRSLRYRMQKFGLDAEKE
jgi:two-component system response regulator PilR (NtrC family)